MQSAETTDGEWKTGPASEMEGKLSLSSFVPFVAKAHSPDHTVLSRVKPGLESDGVKMGTTTKKKKGEHLVKRGAKRRSAKGISKALAVSDKISSRKSTNLKRKALRQSAKQLW